jgi:hypothetical protein
MGFNQAFHDRKPQARALLPARGANAGSPEIGEQLSMFFF